MSKAHARHSPSSLDNLSRCVRFRYKERDDDSADEGTDLHKATEDENLNGLDSEQRTAVQQCLDYTHSLMATEGGPECWDIVKEVKVQLEDLTYGHPDRVLVHKTLPMAHVIDYKFTRVEGEHLFQVRCYGAGVVEMLRSPETESYSALVDHLGCNLKCRNLETVTLHVVAPRLNDITVREFDAAELLRSVREEIEALYEKIDDPWTPETPGDQCGNCARASKCPSLGVTAVVVSRGLGLPVPATFAADAIVDENDRACAQVLAAALQNWGEQVKKNNTEFVRNGGTVPGFKMIRRSTGARIPAERTEEAVVALRAAGYTDEELLQAMTLSIAKLAEFKASLTPGAQAKDIKEELRPLLADVISEGQAEFLQKTSKKENNATHQLNP